MTCEQCKISHDRGDLFCVHCGKDLRRNGSSPIAMIGLATVLMISALLVMEFSVGIIKSGYVFENLSGYRTYLTLIIPMLVNVATLSGTAVQIYYVLLLSTVAVCLGYLFYAALKSFRKSTENGVHKKIEHTALYEISVLFAALFFFEITFSLILIAFGIHMDGPSERDTWKWMFDLLEASVWEELITRVLYIGVPILLILGITKKNEKPLWRYLFGGFRMDNKVVLFIFISAFMFGAGHLTNWGLWKFIPTFIFGLISGYIFVKYGLYATVAMHFLTDYMQAELWLTGIMPFTSVLTVMILIAGIPFFFIYARKGLLFMRNLFKGFKGDESPGKIRET